MWSKKERGFTVLDDRVYYHRGFPVMVERSQGNGLSIVRRLDSRIAYAVESSELTELNGTEALDCLRRYPGVVPKIKKEK